MHVALLAYGTQGDVQPFIALARRMLCAGHTVSLAAPAQYQQLAEPYGIPYAPLPGAPVDFMAQLADQGGKNPLKAFRIMWDFVMPLAVEVYSGMRTACQGADIIIHSFLTGTGGHMIALELDVPDVSAQFFPVFARTSSFPSLVFPDIGLGGVYNQFTHHLFNLLFMGFNHFGYRWVRDHNPTSPNRFHWPYRSTGAGGVPMLFAFSPLVVPRPADWDDGVHLTGYWFMDEPEPWQPPERLAEFMGTGHPPVAVSFSSMKSRDSTRIYAEILNVVSHTNQRAVLLSREGDGETVRDDNVLVMDAVPHEWLFPRSLAVIHHGGAGTTAAALRAGVPNIVVPFANDQPFWGKRVAAIGAGPQPILARKLTSERVKASLRECIENTAMRQRASEIGKRLAAEDGAGKALMLIEKVVEKEQGNKPRDRGKRSKTMAATSEEVDHFYAQTYDVSVADWPGEIDFYRKLAKDAYHAGLPVLELACGTGRVAIRLAEIGGKVVGLDRSRHMLDVARRKSRGMDDIRWVEGDMRAFDLGEPFGLIIIPGHSFQNLVTPEDQRDCLLAVHRHLVPGGTFVLHLDHQNIDWLGGLVGEQGGVFEPAETFTHPRTGSLVRASRAWWYERATQTAIVRTVWEEEDSSGNVISRVECGPFRLHCAFRYEVDHLLALCGFEVQALYGDFLMSELDDEAEEMVWVARKSG